MKYFQVEQYGQMYRQQFELNPTLHGKCSLHFDFDFLQFFTIKTRIAQKSLSFLPEKSIKYSKSATKT